MFFFFGTRAAGAIDRCEQTRVETHFWHLWWLPLVPIGSYLIVGEGEAGRRAIPLGWHTRSVVAGYLRTWSVLFAIASAWLVTRRGTPGIGALAVGLSAAAIGFGLGRLSPEEHARRRVYARHALHPVDPALLAESRHQMAAELRAEIVERARAAIERGYRDAPIPTDASTRTLVAAIAGDPGIRDVDLLGATMTLARIESSLTRGAERAALAAAHDALWHRIREIEPRLLGTGVA